LDGMIDLETLGVEPNSVILTLGAIKFDPFSAAEPHGELYLKLNTEEQESLGREIDDNTLAWWAKQSDSVKNEALSEGDRISVSEFLKEINKFCVGLDNLWCQGPLFDYAMLQNLYRQAGEPCPWNFWQIRDSRTLFAMMPQDPRKQIQEELHNALADSYYQAKCVQQTYKHFGVTKR